MKDPLKPRDKITQKMTRDGAIAENQTTGDTERISKRTQDADFQKSPEQQTTQDAAAPLATAAVCLGSFLSGLLMAILQKGKGLVWGAAEGALFAGLLFILGTLYQSEWETMQFVRAGLVLLMGVLGGILGMLRAERKRR